MDDSIAAKRTHSPVWPSVAAPLIIPALFITEGLFLVRADDVGAFVFMTLVFSLPLSYLASVTLGLPTFSWLRRNNFDYLWVMVALGLVGGPIILIGMMSMVGPVFGSPFRTAAHGALYGGAYAAMWKLIDQLQDRPADKPLQPRRSRLSGRTLG